MKALKYAIVSAILALGIAAPVVSAQEDGAAKAKHSQGSRGDMTAAWLKGITLTADQQTKVAAIKADVKKQVTDAAGDRTKMRGIMQDSQSKIRAVLTAEQQTTFDSNVAAARSHSSKGTTGKGKKSKASSDDSSSGGGE